MFWPFNDKSDKLTPRSSKQQKQQNINIPPQGKTEIIIFQTADRQKNTDEHACDCRPCTVTLQLTPTGGSLNLPISTPKPTHLHPWTYPSPPLNLLISTPEPTHLHPLNLPISTPEPTHLHPWTYPSPPLNLPISTPEPTHLHPLNLPISTPEPTHLHPWTYPSPPLNLPISTP